MDILQALASSPDPGLRSEHLFVTLTSRTTLLLSVPVGGGPFQ